MNTKMTMYEIIQSAIEELKERITDYRDEFYQGEPHDIISELADSNVPVFTSVLMQLAADNIILAVNEPDLGPAFDGAPTPVNIIAANVYEVIEAALWEYWNSEGEALYNTLEEA